MKKDTFRVVTRGADGQLRIKDYGDKDALLKLHTQIGVDDCNTDLELRGMPVFRGLIGPMAEDKNVVRYETPDVFEALTKEWSAQPAEKKRRRRRSKPVADAAKAQAASKASQAEATETADTAMANQAMPETAQAAGETSSVNETAMEPKVAEANSPIVRMDAPSEPSVSDMPAMNVSSNQMSADS